MAVGIGDGPGGGAGAQGPKGDKGDTGAQGPKGDTGNTGTPGTNGTNGLNAANGTTGKAILMGDSEFENGILTGSPAGSTFWGSRNAFMWFQAKANSPYVHYGKTVVFGSPHDGHNVGVGGTSIENMEKRMKRDVARKLPNFAWDWNVTNNFSRGVSAQYLFKIKLQMIKQYLESVGWLVINTVPPRNDSVDAKGFTTAQEAQRIIYNNLLKAAFPVGHRLVTIIDMDANFGVSGSSNPVVLDPTLTVDGLHLNQAGNEKLGNILLALWQARSGLTSYSIGRADDYNAQNAMYGNIVVNSQFTGTTGTLTATAGGSAVANTGVPTNWKVVNLTDPNNTLTITPSIVSVTDLRGNTVNAQQIQIQSGGAGNNTERVVMQPATTAMTNGFVPFAWYRMTCEVQVTTTSAGANPFATVYASYADQLSTIYARMFAQRQSYTTITNSPGTIRKEPLPDKVLSLFLDLPPVQASATGAITSLVLYVDVDGSVAGTRTVRWLNPEITRIPYAPEDLGRSPLEDVYNFNLPAAINATGSSFIPYVTQAGRVKQILNAVISTGTATITIYYTPPGGTKTTLGSLNLTTTAIATTNYNTAGTTANGDSGVQNFPEYPEGTVFTYDITNAATAQGTITFNMLVERIPT